MWAMKIFDRFEITVDQTKHNRHWLQTVTYSGRESRLEIDPTTGPETYPKIGLKMTWE